MSTKKRQGDWFQHVFPHVIREGKPILFPNPLKRGDEEKEKTVVEGKVTRDRATGARLEGGSAPPGGIKGLEVWGPSSGTCSLPFFRGRGYLVHGGKRGAESSSAGRRPSPCLEEALQWRTYLPRWTLLPSLSSGEDVGSM